MKRYRNQIQKQNRKQFRNQIEKTAIALCIAVSLCACSAPDELQRIFVEEKSSEELSETDDSGSSSALSLPDYSDDRKDYESDEVFANFRNVSAGNLRQNMLYRSASPCDNKHNRAEYADRLIREAGIGYVLNLSDDEAQIEVHMEAKDYHSPYYRSLYEDDKVLPLSMNVYYGTEDFAAKVVEGLTWLYQNDGPYLVHCIEGRHRTGFVCMLLEALAGASYDEIADDYMITYENYYGITRDNDPEKYEQIRRTNVDEMIRYMAGTDSNADLNMLSLPLCARSYLLNAGMTELQIEKLIDRITYKYADSL